MNKKRYLIIVGIVAAVVLLSILLHTMLANHQLAISSLKAEADWIAPMDSLNVTCNATAPHGDELSYNWSASGGKITGEGAMVTWTAPVSSGSYNVTVTVTDSRGDEVTDYVTITVMANSPPTITSLIANARWTPPSGTIQVTCTASDPDGDKLSYEWTADEGDISGTGAVVNWTAPQEIGAYNVTVVVKDGYGGEATEKLSLSVNLGTPPTIESLTVTPNGNPYLKPDGVAGCDYEVYQTKKYDIACNVSDTSGVVSYNWSCTNGMISGEGSNITWTAPSTPGGQSLDATVTVIVSDATGNSVPESIVFYVSHCTCPF
jgi:hypothetical protein